MSTSYLWGVDIFGNTYLLSTNGQYWQELKGQQLEMKRVSAVQQCAWGLGCDHQVYVYVHATDVPLRLQVKTFENQRWNPVDGFTAKKMLLHDRWAWSNENGTRECRKSSFQLPSENWSWESDWCVDENIQGNLTGKGGWQYAVNFKRRYVADKKWNSCVRRRKWIRYKRYHAFDSWARIESPFYDALQEPFMDIAVGGYDLPGQPHGYLVVWAVTVLGRIFVRHGIHSNCPEGTHWEEVFTDDDKEVIQLSVGPRGNVWAVLWDGMAAVRCGYSRDHPIGKEWSYVCAPENCILATVSVGTKAVWATTRDGKVWFRKGFNSLQAENDSFSALGVGWVEMVGTMSQVSVGPNDQVWGLGYDEDKNVYFRTGVTPSEASGKEWKIIECKERDMTENFCNNSTTSLVSLLRSISMSEINECQQSEFTRGLIESISDAKLCSSGNHGDGSSHVDGLYSGDSADVESVDSPIESEESKKTVKFFMSTEETTDVCHSDIVEAETSTTSGSKTQPEHVPYWQTTFTHTSDHNCAIQEELTQNTHMSCRAADVCDEQDADTELPSNNELESHNENLKLSNELEEGDAETTEQNESCTYSESQTSESSDVSDTIIDFVNDYDMSHEIQLQPRNNSVSFRKSKSSASVNAAKDALVKSRHSMASLEGTGSHAEGGIATEAAKSDETYACMDSFHRSLSDLCKHYSNAEISWMGISGGGCIIEPSAVLDWFRESRHLSHKSRAKSKSSIYRRKIAKGDWRDKIVIQLEKRQEEEVERFCGYEHAIQQSSWVKRGRMFWWSEHRLQKWYPCHVELEQGGSRLLDESTFTVYYNHHGRQKNVQIPLSSVTSVQHITCPDHHKIKPTFAVITAERTAKRKPLRVAANSYEEMEDWISAIAMSCCDIRGLRGAPSNQAVWSTTIHGDIVSHEPLPDVNTMPCNQMYWHQVGGHLKMVECCPAGVVWGLGYDQTVWIYTGGYGGGPFKGIMSSTTGIHKQTDHKDLVMYQTQRWNPIHGWTDRGFFGHMFYRSEEASSLQDSSQQVQLPSPHWQWVNEWSVDYTLEGGTDSEGWQYANDFPGWYHKVKKWKDYVRRRRFVRKCKSTILGPWLELPPLSLIDVSLQVDAKEMDDDPVALWAIASNGDVVTREGVTRECPGGTNWLHVPSDQPFQSISVGGNYRVWGIAKDGSAYLRNSVNPKNVSGDCWFHVPPPRLSLQQISVGMSAVYAVDTNNGLWYRKDITLTFPEGTTWIHVCNNVHKVSVGPKDQVWILAEKVGGSRWVVCKRQGISDSKPTGVSWDLGIGGGWTHISTRGCTIMNEGSVEIPEDLSHSPQKPSTELASSSESATIDDTSCE